MSFAQVACECPYLSPLLWLTPQPSVFQSPCICTLEWITTPICDLCLYTYPGLCSNCNKYCVHFTIQKEYGTHHLLHIVSVDTYNVNIYWPSNLCLQRLSKYLCRFELSVRAYSFINASLPLIRFHRSMYTYTAVIMFFLSYYRTNIQCFCSQEAAPLLQTY